MIKETVYVNLLNEGTAVLKPVSAIHHHNNVYEIMVAEEPDDDEYEFPLGSLVFVEHKSIGNKSALVAVGLAKVAPKGI